MGNPGNTRVLTTLPSELVAHFEEHGQGHVFRFWDELSDGAKQSLLAQLESIDLAAYSSREASQESASLGTLQPSPVTPLDASCKELGEKLITSGKLGVLTVAGGQGTRLGWSGPKGTFPAAPITGKSLFQLVAEQMLFASKKYKIVIPWYIMTSEQNEEETISFLLDNNCFGIDRTDIFIFSQAQIPAVDANGKMLLATKSSIAMNPDGHGGVVTALKTSGALEEMEARGIAYLSYIQIDNPLVHVVDPVFLGMHVGKDSSVEVSSKSIRKKDATERVGVFCNAGSSTIVVEYSDLPLELATQVDTHGDLVFSSGSIAIHMISTSFLQQVADEMPWHRAHKKVAHIDCATGDAVLPNEPNAYKFERFVFDILPMAERSLVVQTIREEEFAPIKNADGNDSPATSKTLQTERSIRWLRNYIEVSESAQVEISPLTASSFEDLSTIELPSSIGDNKACVV